MGFSQFIGAVKLSTRRHAPEIMYIAGAVSMVGAIVSAFKARPKYEEIMEDHKRRVARRLEAEELADEAPDDIYPDEYRIRDRIRDGLVTGMKLAVCFWKVVAFGGAALAFFFMHGKIYKTWFLSAAAVANEASKKLKALEAATAAEIGKDKVQDIKDRMFNEAAEEHEQLKNGVLIDEEKYPFAKWFDDLNPNWRDDADANRTWLTNVLKILNVRLQAQGYLFANEVWKELNMPLSEYGWTYGIMAKNPDGTTNALTFGMFDGKDPAARNFITGYEPNFLINPNFDPLPIITRVGYTKKSEVTKAVAI